MSIIVKFKDGTSVDYPEGVQVSGDANGACLMILRGDGSVEAVLNAADVASHAQA